MISGTREAGGVGTYDETKTNGGLMIMIDLVYSPDDGGYYFHEYHDTKPLSRVCELIYKTAKLAWDALANGVVKWEEWS